MITFPVCQDKFRYVTPPASEMGKDYEAQIYIGTRVVNAVLSAAISLFPPPLKFAISGMTRSTPVLCTFRVAIASSWWKFPSKTSEDGGEAAAKSY